MRISIAVKLGVLLALVGFVASGLTGYYAYSVSRDLLVQSAKSELLTAAVAVVGRVTGVRTEVSRNLSVLAAHPAALASLQDGVTAPKDQLATLFTLMMKVNPSYFQIRLISASESGMERVRVDLDDGQWVRVDGDDLQEKMHFPYVYETLKAPPGATFLSPIVINHERGAHSGMDKPTVQLATPVNDAKGRAVGVIVINVDLNATFKQLAASLPANVQLFLVNRQGDYLIHPDSSRAFGFDKGRRVLIQDEFPQTADLLSGKVDHLVLEARTGQHAESPLVASFVSQQVAVQSEEAKLILGLAEPLATVLQQADQLKATILKIVLGLFVSSILLAALVSRAVTRPINSMGKAAQQFAQGATITGLPTNRKDELGVLARSFKLMQEQIDQQMSELKERRKDLEHLALHDMLTGLPNRRLFQERLEQAVERARRSGERFALLFIDLDNFKEINDRLSHDAGDAALKGVATRLSAAVRKVDTVARLGGDEFVVLLTSPIQRDQVIAVAQKLLAENQLPIPFGEHALQVNFSVGISQYPEDGLTASEILSSADQAMYEAKAKGAHGLHFSSESSTFPSNLG